MNCAIDDSGWFGRLLLSLRRHAPASPVLLGFGAVGVVGALYQCCRQ
ncbi:hypothetical protein KPB2_5501 [Klebsiella pneumoniae Kb677]|nr:hypothetical protein KPB2_5501 [Klebsiella pneumoniae Kb677]